MYFMLFVHLFVYLVRVTFFLFFRMATACDCGTPSTFQGMFFCWCSIFVFLTGHKAGVTLKFDPLKTYPRDHNVMLKPVPRVIFNVEE